MMVHFTSKYPQKYPMIVSKYSKILKQSIQCSNRLELNKYVAKYYMQCAVGDIFLLPYPTHKAFYLDSSI